MKRAPLAKAIKNWKAGDNGKDAIEKIRQVLRDRKHILPGWSPKYLSNLGRIKTVIDVGVLRGTPSLYKGFPDAYLILVEALPNYREDCEAIIKDRPGELHNVAVGSYDGEIEINFLEEAPARSSVLTHIVGGTDTRTKMAVPMRKIDTLLSERELEGDILLKIDTEGYEMEVLKGATAFLPKVKFVIAETSVRRRHENSYIFADLVTFMQSQGFEVFDVITTTRPGPDIPGASIIDVVFLNSSMEYERVEVQPDQPAKAKPAAKPEADPTHKIAKKLFAAVALATSDPAYSDDDDDASANIGNSEGDPEADEHRAKQISAFQDVVKDIIAAR